MLLSATLLLILNFFLPVISTLAALRFPCFVLFLSAAISLWDFLNLLPLGIKRHIVGNNGRFGFTLKDKEALNVVTFVEELGRLFREEVRFVSVRIRWLRNTGFAGRRFSLGKWMTLP